jgi:hypothetical protein
LDPQLSNPNNRCYNKLFGQFVFVFLKNHPSNNTLKLFILIWPAYLFFNSPMLFN